MVIETSAKTGHNVEEIFSLAGKSIYFEIKKEEEIHSQEEEAQRRSQASESRKKTKLDNKKGKGNKKKNSCC